MKLFNRGNDSEKNAATAPPQAPPVPPIAIPAAPPPPAEPDVTAVLDASVKEISEKLARLASTLEDQQGERSTFEEKLGRMEDRMRKLSSLTEMISSQYNPFVGDAPSEREPLPAVEAGLGLVVPTKPAAGAPEASAAAPSPLQVEFTEPQFDDLPPYDDAEPAAADAAADADVASAEGGAVHLPVLDPGFETNLLMLRWADMLLKDSRGRDSVVEIVHYYHKIGWIGEPVRDQLLAYVDGIAPAAASEPAKEWRAPAELHERSLLFIEKLRKEGRAPTRRA